MLAEPTIPAAPLPAAVLDAARRNVGDILRHALRHGEGAPALLVRDTNCALATTLGMAWQAALPDAAVIEFDRDGAEATLAAFAALPPGALVVLVQSTSFRLEAYRLRVELFKRGLKVVEHVHLSRMSGEEAPRYIDALAYDPAYFRGTGHALKAAIDAAANARIDSGAGCSLHFPGPFEAAKLNIGDYEGMANIGGQFPIGEVFTEAQALESVNGEIRIDVFGDTSFHVNVPPAPITLQVERGRVVGVKDATPAFEEVLAIIRRDEGEVWLREIGFGMNRAFSRERMVSDIGTYERMCGIHLSLGAKHGVYSKPEIKRKDARYHIDVFAATEAVWLDGRQVYRDGAWTV